MKTLVKNSLKVIGVVFLLIGLTGCGPKNNNISVSNNQNQKNITKPIPPETFEIHIAIENGEIALAKVLNDVEEKLGTVRADGVYFYLDDPVLKLDASNFLDYYWTVKLPVETQGEFDLTAYVQKKYNEYDEEITAPLAFSLVIKVKNKKIIDHYIKDSQQYWGTFSVYKIDTDKKRIYFTSNKYTGNLWACSYKGVQNGDYELTVKLIKEKAHEN